MARGFYGLKKDDPDDGRDHKFALGYTAKIPGFDVNMKLDLSPWLPEVYDQGQTSTCTAWTTKECVEFDFINQFKSDVKVSALFPYFNSGVMEGSTKDEGRQIRDIAMAVVKQGICLEDLCPFDPSKVTEKPSSLAYDEALTRIAIDTQSVKVSKEACYMALFVGRPVMIGVELFKEFESDEAAETGMIPMPKAFGTSVGGHAMTLCGANWFPDRATSRNHWGKWGGKDSMGRQGYAHFLSDYVWKYGSDFRVLNTMAGY